MRNDPAVVKGLVLEIVGGDSAGRQIPVSAALELGRDPSLAETIEDEEISRHHARVTAAGDGAQIEDLGSLNGTYVNDQPIEGTQKLSPGDRIRVGLTVMELRSPQQVKAEPSVVEAVPQLTAVGKDVLNEVPEEELAPVRDEDESLPGLLAEEREPAFIRSKVGELPTEGELRRDAVAKLIDVRVKRQTNVAAFALLSLVGLALLIYFGLR